MLAVAKNARPPKRPPTMEFTLDGFCARLFCALLVVDRLVEIIEVERSEPVTLQGSTELVEGAAVFNFLRSGHFFPRVAVRIISGPEQTKFAELSGSETVEGSVVYFSLAYDQHASRLQDRSHLHPRPRSKTRKFHAEQLTSSTHSNVHVGPIGHSSVQRNVPRVLTDVD